MKVLASVFSFTIALVPLLASFLHIFLDGRVTLGGIYHLFFVPQHPHFFSSHPKTGSVTLNQLNWQVEDHYSILNEDLQDAVYVITGSSSGIGLATAQKLQKILGKPKQHRMILAVRNVQKMEELLGRKPDDPMTSFHKDPDEPVVLHLDLSSMESVLLFANELLPSTLKRLREKHSEAKPLRVVLINNAGQAWMPRKRLTRDGFEAQYASNFLGHYLLTRILMRDRKLKRVIHVSSLAHAFGMVPGYHREVENSATSFSFWTYLDTKLMNNLFSNYLSTEKGVKSVAVHPGVVHTAITRHEGLLLGPLVRAMDQVYDHITDESKDNITGESKNGVTTPIRTWLRFFIRMFYLTADEAANNLLYAIFDVNTSGSDKPESSPYVADMKRIPQGSIALDQEAQKWLWDDAEKRLKPWFTEEQNEPEAA